MADRRATLVLSGGGAWGAFQVGAERVLREEYGFRWERIFGVSVGALNGTLLAQQQYEQLRELWLTLRQGDVFHRYPWPLVAVRIGLLRKLGLYSDRPLRRLIHQHAAWRRFHVPLHVGRVSLVSGEYELVAHTAPDFLDAVHQSATIPILWEPLGAQARVDGGLRNNTPLGDALDYGAEQIVVIACRSRVVHPVERPASLAAVARRSLVDIALGELFLTDLREFLDINELVKQAHEVGLTLKKRDGQPYRYCPITVLEPLRPLGDVLDFSPELTRERMRQGEEVARQVLGAQAARPAEPVPPPPEPEPEHLWPG